MSENSYYPDHKPHDLAKFEEMLTEMRKARSVDVLRTYVMLYTFDMSYHREDLLVAAGRVERERGWRL